MYMIITIMYITMRTISFGLKPLRCGPEAAGPRGPRAMRRFLPARPSWPPGHYK